MYRIFALLFFIGYVSVGISVFLFKGNPRVSTLAFAYNLILFCFFAFYAVTTSFFEIKKTFFNVKLPKKLHSLATRHPNYFSFASEFLTFVTCIVVFIATVRLVIGLFIVILGTTNESLLIETKVSQLLENLHITQNVKKIEGIEKDMDLMKFQLAGIRGQLAELEEAKFFDRNKKSYNYGAKGKLYFISSGKDVSESKSYFNYAFARNYDEGCPNAENCSGKLYQDVLFKIRSDETIEKVDIVDINLKVLKGYRLVSITLETDTRTITKVLYPTIISQDDHRYDVLDMLYDPNKMTSFKVSKVFEDSDTRAKLEVTAESYQNEHVFNIVMTRENDGVLVNFE